MRSCNLVSWLVVFILGYVVGLLAKDNEVFTSKNELSFSDKKLKTIWQSSSKNGSFGFERSLFSAYSETTVDI